jgi:pyrimidine operon attenuation protein/uracil phosphoribosyltransferase
MSPAQVERTLTRLAYEIVERNRGADNLLVFGIEAAGARLARSLSRLLSEMEGRTVESHDLDVTAFRDDTDDDPASADPIRGGNVDVTDRDVILVDDVLYTGRTVRAALDAVVRYGRPRSIQLMVLIDRGHREYPIQADYVGRTIPTKSVERVVVEQADDITVSVVE